MVIKWHTVHKLTVKTATVNTQLFQSKVTKKLFLVKKSKSFIILDSNNIADAIFWFFILLQLLCWRKFETLDIKDIQISKHICLIAIGLKKLKSDF